MLGESAQCHLRIEAIVYVTNENNYLCETNFWYVPW